MNETGLIFNIQRYSLNDGSGIRTMVFFKGCRLRCPWCSNPESQSRKIEIMIDEEKKKKYGEYIENINEDHTGTYKKIGKWYTVDELLKELLKDEIFFNTSNGGVTLSGGEILEQGDFAVKILKELKEHGINTAIETCGYGDKGKLYEILKYTDTVLFDLKIIDNKKSKSIIHGDIKIILENLELSAKKNNVIIRFPYIPTYTDDIDNIEAIIGIMKKNNIKDIDILPYHNYGSKKYEYLKRKYLLEGLEIPKDAEIDNVKKIFEKKGLNVKIGG